ncbi:cell division protein FtsA [Sharpea azabuensis]|uniref:Cell division protein FtsA n=1 Tax=Sharpea azabuensis TaxID=322505 RepID=A0A1H6XHH3_9FIRM|nr:cell division protein FtsA [Sharpea azabuensis]HAV17921.1 cell division protein FtsA [Erysipelotrichaceae bacterium]MDD6513516.1 cell division protein FtsA [Sharpea azabuensis]SEJ28533.1 cell division protein FtsA [Sharpea azabuensis]SFE51947.1 cell division protein FtsA [Sharpea azabuensis]SFL24327.1 cell division protein FtsA [Sharpea azabuensis]
MKEIYATLDIGSTTLKLVVAEVISANVNILFSSKVTSHGVRKGVITDAEALVEDIKKVVREADEELNTTITSVGLVLPSINARIYQGDGITKVNNANDKITIDDVIRALKLSTRFQRNRDEEIVSTIPIHYALDTKSTDKLPLGMRSASLKVDSMIVTSKKKFFYGYLEAVEKAGLELLDVTIDAYASALEAFDEAYLKEGAILIDIGCYSSTVSFYEDGYLKYIAQANTGGYDLTKAISEKWWISMDKAERYKIKYGTCEKNVGDDDVIHTNKVDNEVVNYTQQDLSDVLREAVEGMMEEIKTKIDVINDGRSYETVIVGGGGELPSLDVIASSVLNAPVRCYRPETIGVRDMSYVPALGLLYYLNDRKEFLGNNVSLTLPDISSTMNIRLKGFTKAKDESKTPKRKLKRVLENFFSDDE